MSSPDRGPAVKIPPPVIFLTYIGLAYGMERWLQTPQFANSSLKVFGIVLCVSGIILAAVSAYQFLRARTHIEPWKPASSLIVSGIFRYSRNPIYLAFVICTVGLGLYLGSYLIMFAVVPAVISLHFWVIVKEERYLLQRFGQPYADYCKQVRRWL